MATGGAMASMLAAVPGLGSLGSTGLGGFMNPMSIIEKTKEQMKKAAEEA